MSNFLDLYDFGVISVPLKEKTEFYKNPCKICSIFEKLINSGWAKYVELEHYSLGCWQLENESNACECFPISRRI